MTDTVAPAVRSRIMRAVRSRGGKSTERRLRAMLAAAGVSGWTMGGDGLPGSPDFTFPVERIAVFVDGCFWHGCPRCYRRPKSSRPYWDRKVERNRARDRRVGAALRRDGWSVLRLWEHGLTDGERAVGRIRKALETRAR